MSEHLPIEEMELFHRFEELSDWVWDEVKKWNTLAVDTVGKQLIRSVDSVGANLVEGDGRYTDADSLHFFIIARASARETRYWLRRSARRNLLSQNIANERIEALKSATQLLNRLITYRRSRNRKMVVKESGSPYSPLTSDPFVVEDSYLST